MRHFLFLQGPHGPFFALVGKALVQSKRAKVWRVGFNAGDEAFWNDPTTYLPFQEQQSEWPRVFRNIIQAHTITDIALYGDTRPIHAIAIAVAKELGLRIHIFEEGYLRPWWVTYERNGSNGHSDLMQISLTEIQSAQTQAPQDLAEPPAHWGEMRQHMFYGAYYHWYVFWMNRKYSAFKRHRELPVGQEAWLYTRRLLLMPLIALERRYTTQRILKGKFAYHLVLMQLEHDTSFQFHSPFKRMAEFIELTIKGFAAGAPSDEHLVFKAHPLETGRFNYTRMIKEQGAAHGVAERVHYVRGGKLGALLNRSKTAITVNSTAGQQALWRGIPLRIFGDAVYNKPEFVSCQPIDAFFANPTPPDMANYYAFRDFLLATSQIPGGYYSSKGRAQLCRLLPPLMLDNASPYARQLGHPSHE